ncbi:hypothetical protein KAZ93_01450 [Patescibacteria group bacterium]|nr:hypothetical protein [Patescibacteria group bacterium]
MLIYILPNKRSIFFESELLVSSDKFVVAIADDLVAVLCLRIVDDRLHDGFTDALSFVSFPGDDVFDMSGVFASSHKCRLDEDRS